MKIGKANSTKEFESVIQRVQKDVYVFRLYVAGTSPCSMRAITNIKRICEQYLKGQYELEIIDIHQQPAKADVEELLAAPTLIKKLPIPVRKLIGDMSDTSKVLLILNLKTALPKLQHEK